ncbi:lysine biosynthesis protein LysX [Candidatus Acetothermia bacterium]|nr:lysine biosynthesis protein LysX [Candidatus Acetothermia bacterium]MBI3460583.1 lysine biosynthesis protein LysX [Candidatus Acetothermia bacterium]MBI3659809.1 lysine biosynthesis protein LysX [Candidatus Acetothermia bacterium]
MKKVRLGILFSRLRLEEKLLFEEARKRKDVELVPIDSRELIISLDEHPKLDVLLDREISQSRALYALQLFEDSGVKTVNTFETVRIGGDKLLTSKVLYDAGVPTPNVKVAFTKESALGAIEEMGYPVVLKPVDGSWGRLMAKIENRTAAEAILEHKAHLSSYYHTVFYIQEYVKKPDRDIRAFVIGGETIGAAYRASDHWLTNAARGARTVPCPVTPELNDLCLRAAKAVGGQALAVDLMETENGLTVHEVNCAMEFKASMQSIEADIPALLLDYCVKVAQENPVKTKPSAKPKEKVMAHA